MYGFIASLLSDAGKFLLDSLVSVLLGLTLQKAIKIGYAVVTYPLPKKIKTPFGDRFAQPEPIETEYGGLLFPFMETSKAVELISQWRRMLFTFIGLIIWGVFLALFKAAIPYLPELTYYAYFVYTAISPIFGFAIDPLKNILTSNNILLMPEVIVASMLLAFVGDLIRSLSS